jgi:hypothetical protein
MEKRLTSQQWFPEDCFLGASNSLSADAADLTEAHDIFQEEAQALDADYVPQTVNTDGW